MGEIWIGKRTSGSAFSVKVMKGSNDPTTTPNDVANAGRFLFNSEFRDQLYVDGIFEQAFQNVGIGTTYLPAGTGPNTYHRRRETFLYSGLKVNRWHFHQREWGLPWEPIIEFRGPGVLGTYKGGPSSRFELMGESGDGVYWLGKRIGTVGYTSGYSDWWDDYVGPTTFKPVLGDGGHVISGGSFMASVLELPSTSAALANPSNTPVAGQRNVLMNPSQIVISRPGFTTSSSGRNLIVDSNRIPAKVIASGETFIAAGAVKTIESPVTLTDTTYVDYHLKAASVGQWTHPPLQTGSLTSKVTIPFRWRINAGNVQLHNQAGFGVDVRYMICADDGQQSSGGSMWMRKIGNEWQIKRPGSSDSNPRLSDIMLDTRFSYIPILDEGYIPLSAFTEAPTSQAHGEKAQTINFDLPGGMVPFVKFVVRQSITYSNDLGTYTLTGYREPVSELFMGQIESQAGGGQYRGRQSNMGTVAVITNSSVKFHVAHINPFTLNFSVGGDVVPNFFPRWRPVGIRYFIYGIPNS